MTTTVQPLRRMALINFSHAEARPVAPVTCRRLRQVALHRQCPPVFQLTITRVVLSHCNPLIMALDFYPIAVWQHCCTCLKRTALRMYYPHHRLLY